MAFCVVAIVSWWNPALAQEGGGMSYPGKYVSPADSIRLASLFQRVMATYQQYPDSALLFSEQAYELARNIVTGGDHPDLANAISNLGFFYDAMGDRERARPLYVESLAMRWRMYAGDHRSLAQAMNNMAYFHYTSGEYAAAETLFVAAQEMKTRLYAGDDPEIAIGLNNLAVFFDERGNWERARAYYDSCLAMMRRLYPAGAAELAQAIGNVGYFLVSRGRLREGETMYTEALAMYGRLFTGDHESLITMRNNLGYLYEKMGRLPEAEHMYVQALESARRLYAGDHPVKATTVSNLGSYYLSRGMDAEAEPLYIEALEIRRRLYPEGNPELLTSINNMGYYHTRRGRYSEAAEMYAAAEPVLDRIAPGDHPNRALHYNNVASLLAEQGRFAEAESLYTAALEMKQRLFDRPHTEIALAYNNIGTVLRDQGRQKEAAAMFTRALEIFRSLEENVDFEISVTLGNLGRIETDLGNPDEGLRYLEDAQRMKEALFGDGHIERIAAERNLAQAYAQLGRNDDAGRHLRDLLYQLGVSLRLSFEFDSEAHQLEFMNNVLKPNLDLLTLFCLRNADRDPSVPALMLQALLQFKGAVANESARRSAEWSKDKFAIEVRNELTRLREQDAQLSSRPQDEQQRAERRLIQRRADSLDAALRKLDREYEKLRTRQEADWREIQRQLKQDEALVEFAAVPCNSRYERGSDTLRYAAVILHREGAPLLVPLANEQELQPFFAAPVHPRVPSYVTDRELSKSLASLVWSPLERHLEEIRRIYIVPDGLLHRLSFHALTTTGDEGTDVYLDDKFELHLLTGSRDLLSRNVRYRPTPYRRPENALLVGDPLFSSLDGSEKQGETRAQDDSESGDDVTRGGTWLPLPGTRREVERLYTLCRESNVPAATLTGREAREEQIKLLSGNAPRILHIATHGFFFPVPRLRFEELPLSARTRSGAPQLRIEDNPMLRSGIVLTGANEVWTGGSPPPRGDDGILSALEVSRLDFSGTELVTLSACETGLGDITNGEGIFGLQRAFQVAGAARLLMTLWRVADDPTMEIMTLFYEKLLGGVGVEEALRQARKDMRTRYSSPYYWAAFVLVEQ